jgi:ribose transport system permease protein
MTRLSAILRTDWLGLAVLVLVGGAALGIARPEFLTPYNIDVILVGFSLTVVYALGQAVIIAIGHMNLALGATGCLVAVAFGGSMEMWGLPLMLAVPFGLLIGGICGFLNGWLTYRSGLTSFIITLATLSIFKGMSLGITQAQPFYGIPDSVKAFGSDRWGPLPETLLVSLPIVIAVGVFFARSIPGRQLLAYGGNPAAAELSGISRARVVIIAHTLSGVLAAVAGMMSVARLQNATPSIGDEWLIASFAAPVVGGAVLSGGHISVIGTCLGVLIVALINQALVMLAVDPFYVQVLLGLLILGAVGLNRLREARLGQGVAIRLS